MYPGPDDPDLGTFVAQVERALGDRGHEIERAVLNARSGGKRRHFRLAAETARVARRFRPDVVYAHFLVPTGFTAAVATRAPLVVTAHGRDVRNIGAYPGIEAATRFVVRRASALIAVSDYLRRELELKIPEAKGKTHVVDCGVDLELWPRCRRPEWRERAGLRLRGQPDRAEERRSARRGLRAPGAGPTRLRGRRPAAFAARGAAGRGGRGPRAARPRSRATSRRRTCSASPRRSSRSARRCSRRWPWSAPSSRRVIGGPPEFVSPEAGVLVDPLDTAALADGLRRAAELPVPNKEARDGRRRARPQASGGADRGDSRDSRSRSASLSSTSGRTVSSSPASRATCNACS